MTAITFTSSPSVNQTRVSNGYSWYWTGSKWKAGTNPVSATPGTGSGAVTYSFGTDIVHAFTSSGTLTLNSTVTARILVVAGGGGGNHDVGGGGGGGVLYYTGVSMTAGTYTITVGTGGLGGIYNIYGGGHTLATNGNDSSIIGGSISYTAIGGGHGGGEGPLGIPVAGGNGGSGGGGYRNNDGAHPGSGISGQGYNGIEEAGGGAWNVGGHQTDGGPGIINDIAGFPLSFGGGGAGSFNYGVVQSIYGYPGLGGGGGNSSGRWYGNTPPGYTIPSKSTITNIRNSWSYGGGGSSGNLGNFGFAGFQGIVIVRYPNTGYNIP